MILQERTGEVHLFPPHTSVYWEAACIWWWGIWVLGRPWQPSPAQTSSHQHSLQGLVGKVCGGGERQGSFLKGGVTEGQKGSSPAVAQGWGEAEGWRQAPRPARRAGSGVGAEVKGRPGIQSVVYADHLPCSGLLPIQPI